MVYGSFNLLEPSGPVKACIGTALTFTVKLKYSEKTQFEYHFTHQISRTGRPGIVPGVRK
jgi:hypothetical protein